MQDLRYILRAFKKLQKNKIIIKKIACEQALRGTGAGVEGEPARTALNFERRPSE